MDKEILEAILNRFDIIENRFDIIDNKLTKLNGYIIIDSTGCDYNS